LGVNKGQSVSGRFVFTGNEKFSYTVGMRTVIDGSNIASEGVCHLHDQMYHYLNQG
jgi:hypothetical protein